MTKVDKIGPEDWVTVDKIGRTEILGPAKNGCYTISAHAFVFVLLWLRSSNFRPTELWRQSRELAVWR
jgi:hypothetical protein